MKVSELMKRIKLIIGFIVRMDNEIVPYNIQKIIIKNYAHELNFNLTDRIIDNILKTSTMVTLIKEDIQFTATNKN